MYRAHPTPTRLAQFVATLLESRASSSHPRYHIEVPVRFTAATVLLGLVACGDSGGAGRASTIDSAGIAIVTNTPAERVDSITAARWRVGSEDGPLNDVGDLAVTASGLVVVANNGNHTVVALGADGAEQWRFGRTGDGPGEFRGFLSLATVGDTTYVFDFVNRKLTAVGPDGTLKGVTQIAPVPQNLELAGGLSDGTLLFTSRLLGNLGPGVHRDSVNYLRVRPDGTMHGTLGWGRYQSVDFLMGEFGPNIHDEALGATGSVAAHGNGVAHADGDVAEVVVRGETGAISRLIRWTGEPVPVGDADRDAFIAAEREATADEFQQRQLEAWIPEITWPTHLPMTGMVLSRPGRRMLVAEYCALGRRHCGWRDIDDEGRWRRTVVVPVRATDAVATATLLVTLSVDDQGFERVEAWSL